MNKHTKFYSLSYPQKGVWFLEKMHSDTSIGNICATLKIKAGLDGEAANKAFNCVLRLNDALRIRVDENNGDLRQYISDYRYQRFDYIDFSDKDIDALYVWDTKMSSIPIYQPNAPLYYFAILKITEDVFGFYVKLHHLIADAWTLVTFGNDLAKYYFEIIAGNTENFVLKPTYIDYLDSEIAYLESERFKADQEYWMNRFETIPEPTVIKDKKTAKIFIKTSRKTFILPEKLCNKISQHCQENKTSIFSLYLSAMAVYINRTQSKNDVIFGTPVLNRINHKEKNMMGMFVSSVPIRLNVDINKTYNSFAEDINKEWISLLRHQKYPFNLLIKKLREKNPGLEKLYDIAISYQNAKFIKNGNALHQEGRWHFNGYQKESLYIHINEREDDGKILLDYDYHNELFQVKEIEFFHDHVIRLMWHALDNPLRKLSDLDMLSEHEKNKILNDFNDTGLDYMREKTIHELFEEQVKKSPKNIALIFENATMTYEELNYQANCLALELRRKGVRRGDVVGIFLNRSFAMVAAIFAVMKAGVAYLPIDPGYPESRITYMLEDSGSSLLISTDALCRKLGYCGKMVDVEDGSMYIGSGSNNKNINTADDIAYVIYTSGSTGKPKGVLIEHRSVNNFIEGVTQAIDFSLFKTIISVTTISFDIFVLETILPLVKGLKVVITNEEEQKIPKLLVKAIIDNKVDILQTTPSRMSLFLEDEDFNEALFSLSCVLIGGEPFPAELIQKLNKNPELKIYNMYGPTETTVWSTIKKIKINESINIGRPIANTQIYILDAFLNPVPIGTEGDLYIGGEGLARGYLKRPELTREKFICNPFGPGRIYKTGDRAKWYARGEIMCLGRNDHQVKIRGQRIELGEIEHQLLEINRISKALVVTNQDKKGNNFLCAYYISDAEIPVGFLRKELQKNLPAYMVPLFYKRVTDFPYTLNGKIDKSKLPLMGLNKIAGLDHSAPANRLEKILADEFSSVLNIQDIGVENDFFDLGGDSLAAIQLQISLSKHGWDLKMQDIYKYKTVRDLAKWISLIEKKESVCVEKEERTCFDHGSVSWDSLPSEKSVCSFNDLLITGATGFLGIHLTDYLLSNTNIKIHCIIRGDDYKSAVNKLVSMLEFYDMQRHVDKIGKRLFVIPGDITSTSLLSLLNKMQRFDALLHLAANVRYIGDYSDLYEINVQGTKNMMDYALNSGIPFYHFSTMGVSGNLLVDQSKVNPDFFENDLDIGQSYNDNVYVRSKYEAEKLIYDYREKGLDATILRIGNLTGRHSDGRFQINIADNYFYNVLRVLTHNQYNIDALNIKELEFTPVDKCSEAAAKLILYAGKEAKTFHVYNNNYIDIRSFLGMIKDEANNAGKTDRKQNNNANIVNYRSEMTRSYLQKLDYNWPEIDRDYITRLITYMHNVGFV